MNTMLKIISRSLIIVSLLLVFYIGFHHARDGFYLGNIFSDFRYHPDWNIPLSQQDDEVVKRILNQPFYYIGKGGQAYAFESQDRKYVIKFLRSRIYKQRFLNSILTYIPFCDDRKTNEIHRRTKNIYDYFNGYRLIYNNNKESAALMFLHFNPTYDQFGQMTLYDRVGIKHSIDLDQVAFVLQQKASTFADVMKNSLNQNDLHKAEQHIRAVFNHLIKHYQKGLYDRDYGVFHNIGFNNDKPIFIDAGKIAYKTDMSDIANYTKEVEAVSFRMKDWIKKYYPSHFDQLSLIIDSQTADYTANPQESAALKR